MTGNTLFVTERECIPPLLHNHCQVLLVLGDPRAAPTSPCAQPLATSSPASIMWKNLLIPSWQREKESRGGAGGRGGGGGRQVAHGLIFFSFSFSVIFTRVKPKDLAFDYPSIFSQQEAALHQRHAAAQRPTHSTLPLMLPDRFSEGFSAFTRLLPSKQTWVERHTR